MWKEFKDPPSNNDEQKMAEKKEAMRSAFPDLMHAHKVIGDYIAELGWFSLRAVKNYADHIVKHPWKSLDDMVESQAMYGMYLHKAHHKKCSLRELYQIKDSVKEGLLREYEAVTNLHKILGETQAEFDKQQAIVRQANTEAYCGAHGAAIVDIPIVAEWDGGQDDLCLRPTMDSSIEITPMEISANDLLD